MRTACDFRVKNDAASQRQPTRPLGDEHRLGSDDKANRPLFSPQVQVSRERARDRLSGCYLSSASLAVKPMPRRGGSRGRMSSRIAERDRGDGFVMLREVAVQA
jgi:hypothetical protein